MANFIVSYDLNGPHPTHDEMDDHLAKLGYARGRVLETVWYVAAATSTTDLHGQILSILSVDDRLLVVEASEASLTNLLINDESLIQSWNANR